MKNPFDDWGPACELDTRTNARGFRLVMTENARRLSDVYRAIGADVPRPSDRMLKITGIKRTVLKLINH